MARIKETRSDMIFNFINYTVLVVALLVTLYPLYFIIIASFSDPDAVNTGRVLLLPHAPSLDGYLRIFQYDKIWVGYRNTIFYTLLGSAINVVLTITSGYAISRKDLVGRNLFVGMMMFTMLFSGGLIPNYLLVKDLGMIDTIWAMVIPNAVGVWNVFITRTFFATTIPDELLEAAQLDGCSNTRFFTSIVLPLSSAIIAVVTLFYGVQHWNAFFHAMIYLNKEALMPLQIVLRDILVANQVQSDMMADVDTMYAQMKLAESIKYGIIIVSTLPILMVYPLLQRYFVKGVMIGAIKG